MRVWVASAKLRRSGFSFARCTRTVWLPIVGRIGTRRRRVSKAACSAMRRTDLRAYLSTASANCVAFRRQPIGTGSGIFRKNDALGAKYWEGDYWDNVGFAVARAGQDHPFYQDTTYRDAGRLQHEIRRPDPCPI